MQLKYDDPADPSKQVYGSYSGLYFAAIDQGAYYKETNYDMNGKALLSYEVIKNLNLKFEFGAKYKLVDFDSFLPLCERILLLVECFSFLGCLFCGTELCK